ncbi:putative Mediator of RNA polymerase II transcription subunit 13 [Quillaja saponaria]|uniref:Mediator of RNA polymerase II transcription subunit 13 n=1 Tax=Quillaja saponaria TaxID=32244 RepID=A0AAD7LMI7_QUISA|nr:putative Mediator of RNA polymerase II transcription subunit 13 [Quillaja saponaria]
MERRKKGKDGTDELAIIKAAAWAWFQHGSGSEGKPMSEFDLTRITRERRPSRYKLEAMRITKEELAKDSLSETLSLNSMQSTNSLLDSYEVQSISRRLDDFIESSSNKYGNGFLARDHDDDGRNVMKKKKKKGFWPRHAVVCGTRKDVVEDSRVSRRSEKGVLVVNKAKSRPWANHGL